MHTIFQASTESDSSSLMTWVMRARQHTALTIALNLIIASIVAVVDFAVGDQIPLAVCYLPSIVSISLVVSLRLGASLAMAASTAWLIDDLLLLGSSPITVARCWIAVVHGGMFAIVLITVDRLFKAHQKEHELARTDHLTGSLNLLAFRQAATSLVERRSNRNEGMTLAFLDCDNFKFVNDEFGHHEGDRLLVTIAQTIQAKLRRNDTLARMGGDEFVILLPSAQLDEARDVIDRVREQLALEMARNGWPVTFSIGVAVYSATPTSVDSMIGSADHLMYEVKNCAKNDALYRIVA